MPIVKYYQKKTWYSGLTQSGFHVIGERPKTKGGWFYPDEHLIAHILKQYCLKRGIAKQFEIIVLHEPWSLSSSSPIPRDHKGAKRGNGDLLTEGEENSGHFKQIIQQAVQKQRGKKGEQKKSAQAQALILAPFLLGRHHPGIAIDMRHNRAVYLDPKSWEPYPKAKDLLNALEAQDITTERVTLQQQRNDDTYSCGPILTASMMQWIEEFIQDQPISSKHFTVNRQGLATDRLFQMYVNNNPIADEKATDNLVDEIMLADVQLWEDFLQEMQAPDPQGLMQLIREDVNQQKAWIESIVSLPNLSERNGRKLQWIMDYQARMIECIFLDEKPKDKIEALHTFNQQLFAEPTQEHGREIVQVEKRDLLQDPYFSQMYAKLQKLGCRAALQISKSKPMTVEMPERRQPRKKNTVFQQIRNPQHISTWLVFLLLSALIFLILYASDILPLLSPWFLLLIIPAASLVLTASWHIIQIFCNQKSQPLHSPLPVRNPRDAKTILHHSQLSESRPLTSSSEIEKSQQPKPKRLSLPSTGR